MGAGRAVLLVLAGAAVGAALLSAVSLIKPQPVGGLALVGALAGGLLGAVLALVGRSALPERVTTRPGDPYLSTLDRTERRAFRREALRGPVPADLDRRAAAIRYVRRTMDDENAGRLTSLIVNAWWTIFGAVSVANGTVWFLIPTVGAAAVFVWTLRRPGFLRRRLAALRAG